MRRSPGHNAGAAAPTTHPQISCIPKSPAAQKIRTANPSAPTPTPPFPSEVDESQTTMPPQSSAHPVQSAFAVSEIPAARSPHERSNSPRETATDSTRYQTHPANLAAPP